MITLFTLEVVVRTHTQTHTNRTDSSTWTTKMVGNTMTFSDNDKLLCYYNTLYQHSLGGSTYTTCADSAVSFGHCQRDTILPSTKQVSAVAY